jgi:hypothetical protein
MKIDALEAVMKGINEIWPAFSTLSDCDGVQYGRLSRNVVEQL